MGEFTDEGVINALKFLIDEINENKPKSRENSLTITKLEEAQMWYAKGIHI